MPTTKKAALKEKHAFERKYPHLRCQIIDNTKVYPKRDGLRYNFRFKRK
jgi:hypothetical protein